MKKRLFKLTAMLLMAGAVLGGCVIPIPVPQL